MVKTILSKVLMPIYFIVSALVLEVVTFNMLNLGLMPEYFFYNFSVILILAFVIFVIPNYTAQYVLYTIVLLVQVVFIYVNYSLYKIYGDMFSIDMLGLVGEAGAAMTSSFIYLSVILQLIGVYLSVVVCGGVLLGIAKKHTISLKEHFSIFNVIILVVLQCFSWGYFVHKRQDINNAFSLEDVAYANSDTFLMNTSFLKTSSYQKFGTYGYFTNLFVNNAGSYQNKLSEATINYFNSGEIYDGNVYAEGQESLKIFGEDSGNNVIVIMMESLEWLCFGDGNYDPTLSNLSYEMTPNIYNLINSDRAMISSNFFAKSKTNYSEAYSILGNYPVGNGLSGLAGKNYNDDLNAFGYSLPNVLKNEGYTTTYIHSNEISFYDRDKTHNNIGFDTVVGKDRIVTKDKTEYLRDEDGNIRYTGEDLEFDHWEAEGDFAGYVIDYIIPKNYNEKPFYSFYLNVSSHGSYEYNTNEVDCLRYKDYVMYGEQGCTWDEDLRVWKKKAETAVDDYSTWYQNVLNNYQSTDAKLVKELLYYECGVVGLDEALKVIVDKLNEYNIFDKTTLVLYSDHYSYYNSLSNRVKGIEKNDISNIELNTIPFIISSPCLKEYSATNYPDRSTKYLVNDRFCSAYDIMPTVFDLLGVEFNENLYLGQSLFKPADYVYTIGEETKDMVVYYSNTGGLFSQDIYTYDLDTFVKYNPNVDSEDIEIFKSCAYQLLKKINFINILNSNYLFNRLAN